MLAPMRALLLVACSCSVLSACSPPTTSADAADPVPQVAVATDAEGGSPQPVERVDAGDGSAPTLACMMSGTIDILGVKQEARDCMVMANDMPEADFRNACTSLAGLLVGGTIEYIDRCPMPAQGICRNFNRSGMDGYYYQRTAEDVATTLPQSCTAMGGTWTPAG